MLPRRRRRDDNVEDEPRAAPARREVIVDDQKFEDANAADIGDEQIVYSPIYPSYSPAPYEEQKGNVPDEQKSSIHMVDPNALPGQDELSTDDGGDSDEGDEGDLDFWVRQEEEEEKREVEEQRRRREREEERRLEEELENEYGHYVFPTDEERRQSERQKDQTIEFRNQMYEAGQAARDREHEIYIENQRNMQYTDTSHPDFGTEVRAIAQRVNPENPEMVMEYFDNNVGIQRALYDMHLRGRALLQPTRLTDEQRDEQRRGILRRIDISRAQSRANAQRNLLEFERRRLEDERIENEAIANLEREIVEFPEHFGLSNIS
jgi:hypothetical protein